MAKLSVFVLVAISTATIALPQRNLNYPTTPRPTEPTEEASTTENSAPYPAAGFRPGRAFNLPTEEQEKKVEEPPQSYGPPADKYGPPEDSTTTQQPELDETTTISGRAADGDASARIPSGLKPGFYFIQLPGGAIQRVALLTNAAPESAETNDADAVEEVEDIEQVSPANNVQPTIKTQTTIESWPPRQQNQVVEVRPVVVETSQIAQPVRSQPIVAVEPVLFVQPKSYSYISQYRSW